MAKAIRVKAKASSAAGLKGDTSTWRSRVGWCVVLLLAVAFCVLAAPSRAQQPAPTLRVDVRGAKPKVALTETVKLKAVVTWRGPEATFTYQWAVLNGPPLSASATDKEELVIPPGDLRSGLTVKLRLTVTVKWLDADVDPPEEKTDKSETDVTFEVNAPPRGGDCRLNFARVRDNKADINISAPDWKDDDPPIQYRFVLLHQHKPVHEQKWSFMPRAMVRNLELSMGDHLQVECYVRDRFHAVSDKVSAVISF